MAADATAMAQAMQVGLMFDSPWATSVPAGCQGRYPAAGRIVPARCSPDRHVPATLGPRTPRGALLLAGIRACERKSPCAPPSREISPSGTMARTNSLTVAGAAQAFHLFPV